MSEPQDTDVRGRTAAAASLVSYQDGSIVSRTLVDQDCGTVTLFAFDKGQSLSEHTAPYDALVLVLEGEAEIRLSGRAHAVRAGEMIIMPADEPHAVIAMQRLKMLLVMIHHSQ